jgi:hypothetical protein
VVCVVGYKGIIVLYAVGGDQNIGIFYGRTLLCEGGVLEITILSSFERMAAILFIIFWSLLRK